MHTLALFDIDKTLLLGVKSHRASFHKAFREIYGVETTIDVIEHNGMTDQQIIIGVLKNAGLNEETIEARLGDCRRFMVEEFERIVGNEEVVPLPGVNELLEELSRRNVLLGLVTGNLERIAGAKLKKAGLAGYFKFGAFGSDAIERSDLVKLAIKRAEENSGLKFNNIFLFGDTLKDIKAGKESGVKTVGVATGSCSTGKLKEAGADFVLENLKDKDKILGIIFRP